MSAWTMLLDSSRVPMYGARAIRSVQQAKWECLRKGVPENVVMEFFMGVGEPTGLDFAEWLVKLDQDMNGQFIPLHFEFYVHSQNEEGRKQIEKLLGDYIEAKKKRFLTEHGHIERRDRRNPEGKPLIFERRIGGRPQRKGHVVWGNLSGSDYARHTKDNLLKDRRSH